jgi:acetyltransferase
MPPAMVPQAIGICAMIGVKVAHISTSGFRASEEAEGIRPQEAVMSLARHGRVRVVGPNCMGIHSLNARLTYIDGVSPKVAISR